jgi:hypothetical protein
MTTAHTGHGFAIRKGQPYQVPDQAELSRRAAQREADAKQARRDALAETEEKERLAVATNHGEGSASRSYYQQGGRRHYRWVVTAVPIEDDDPFAGVDENEARP